MTLLHTLVLALTGLVDRTVRRGDRDDRGDVPGWVLITVMTAALVAVIWGVAESELSRLLRQALGSVSG